jgi:carboxylesterase type B
MNMQTLEKDSMTTKKTKAVAKQLAIAEKEKTENIAKVTLLPSANAAAVVTEYAKAFGEQDFCALVDALRPHMNDVNDGNLQHCEAMLVGQAHALQSIFVNLARRAVNQEYLKQYETYRGRLRKRKIKHAKPVAAVAMA